MLNETARAELYWKKFSVLSDGFVCLADVMGDDSSIVQAARVSYGIGTKHTSNDRTLIRYLMRHRHTTPFEMAEIKLMVRVPMDCWRQWIRHRTANVNEYSTRYSEAIDSMDKTNIGKWRKQSKTNKQGSDEYLAWEQDDYLSRCENALHDHAKSVYKERLASGVAREQARKDLPLSTYTEAYWKIDLHNMLHFLSLRMDPHAQLEIRSYAEIIGREIVAKLFPFTWEAFEDYRLNAMCLSDMDQSMIYRLMNSHTIAGLPFSLDQFMLSQMPAWREIKKCRERDECLEKLRKLGIVEKETESNV